jgi:hypothetical protein
MLIAPPYAHMHCDESVSAGLFPTSTVGEPGTHGAGSTGVHVPGVNTPSAAAVCAAVMGLARLLHRPNGAMLRNGLLSMIVAIGMFSTRTLFSGSTLSVLGATPNVQSNAAPLATGIPIAATVPQRRSAKVRGA